MKNMFGIFCTLLAHFAMAQSAKEIVEKADNKMRGNTSQAVITIQTIRPGWSRQMTVRATLKGRNLATIVIESPAKEKGIVYLKRNKEVWYWLPSLEKVIKLPPSMMSQSWMGTDFTNDDLVKESSIISDYEHRIIGDTLIEQRNCYLIEMIPKVNAAVIWGKLIFCIDKTDYIEIHCRFYDEDGVLANTMKASDIKRMDGRLIPTRFEMIPADKINQKTVMIYQTIQFNRPLEDELFTIERIKRIEI